jgi:hypothetical protein
VRKDNERIAHRNFADRDGRESFVGISVSDANLALFDILPRLAAACGTAVEFVNGEAAEKLSVAGGMVGWVRQSTRNSAG